MSTHKSPTKDLCPMCSGKGECNPNPPDLITTNDEGEQVKGPPKFFIVLPPCNVTYTERQNLNLTINGYIKEGYDIFRYETSSDGKVINVVMKWRWM